MADEKMNDAEKITEQMIAAKEKSEQKENKEGGLTRDQAIDSKNKPDFKRMTREERDAEELKKALEEWKPKTVLGRKVNEGKIKDIDEIIGQKILESFIVDKLINLSSDLLSIGQSKGKFGGGKRRAWKQTQRKTGEGNVPSFATMAVVGDKNGHVGIGFGKAKETLPAREKALRKAKLDIIKVTRGCGSFDCFCHEGHSIPFKVEGKCGSSKIVLYPAPEGTGLVIGNECKKILSLAGIEDVYSKTFGQTKTTLNLARACIDALKKTNKQTKLKEAKK
jgi:small subunit ribosomal protein S5